MPRTFDSSLRRITLLWLFSLAVIAVLALSSDILINNTATRSETFADFVNVAGRQRMWTSQIALQATQLVMADSATARATYVRRLRQSVDTMRIEYDQIRRETAQIPAAVRLFEEGEQALNRLTAAYWEACEALLSLQGDQATAESEPYTRIADNSQILLIQMDGVVRALIDYNTLSKRALQQINTLRVLTVMVILAGQFAFVFRPAIARIRQRANALETEIAERKRAEAELRASESRFRSLVETAPVGIFQSDAQGTITWVNTRWKELMGLTGDESLGMKWRETIHADDRDRVLDAITLKTEVTPNAMADYRIMRGDGSTLTLHATATPLLTAQGETGGILGTIMDITQRKVAEERALKLEAERQRIRVLGEFIRDTSHDLRTPLTVIKSGLYFIRKLTDLDRIRERAGLIDAQVDYLNIVIEQLQEMATLDSLADLTLVTLDIGPLLQDAVQDAYFKKRETPAAVEVDIAKDLPPAYAAPDRLISAFRAVLDNARRYTPAGGLIKVQARAEDGQVVITVADNGIGIPSDQLARVFERFYKVDSARGIGGGAGLGLPIARRIIDLHGGRITLESALGQGTTVRLMLRAAVS